MAREYTLRTKEGLMVAKIGYKMFNRLLLDIEGHWDTDNKGVERYYIEEAGVYGFHAGRNVFRVYFWEGYTISEDG